MSICDFLFSADLCVPAAAPCLETLKTRLGLPQPGPGAFVQYDESGWDVVFALVNKAFAAAPTRLEIIAPPAADGPRPDRFGRRVFEDQAPRAWRTHATVVAVPDLDALVERARAKGLRFFFEPMAENVPFDKLWMGSAHGDIGDYDSAADDGFRFEFIPSNSVAFSPKLFETPVDVPRPGETGFRRIRHRAFLVADLEASLRSFEDKFGWTPAGAVKVEPGRGYRFADMSTNHGHGAGLRLVQATDPDSAAGRDFAAQGAGPYTITIATFDLTATAADLAARGTAFNRLPNGAHEPEALVPDLGEVGAPFVLVPDA